MIHDERVKGTPESIAVPHGDQETINVLSNQFSKAAGRSSNDRSARRHRLGGHQAKALASTRWHNDKISVSVEACKTFMSDSTSKTNGWIGSCQQRQRFKFGSASANDEIRVVAELMCHPGSDEPVDALARDEATKRDHHWPAWAHAWCRRAKSIGVDARVDNNWRTC